MTPYAAIATRLRAIRLQCATTARNNGMDASQVIRDSKGHFQGRIGGMIHEVALANHLRREAAYTAKHGAEAFAKRRDMLTTKATAGAQTLTPEHRAALQQEHARLAPLVLGKGVAARNAQRDRQAIAQHLGRAQVQPGRTNTTTLAPATAKHPTAAFKDGPLTTAEMARSAAQISTLFSQSGAIPPYGERYDATLAAANQRRIVTDLAARLQDNPDFHTLARTLKRQSGLLDESDPTRHAVDVLLRKFAASSREGALVVALHLAVRKEFGLAAPDHFEKRDLAAAKPMLAKHEAALRAFARAQYDATQAFFRAQGVKPTDTIILYRGHGSETPPPQWQPGGRRQAIAMQPLSSWSAHLETANHFTYESPYSRIIAAHVPVSRIFSTERTGLGAKLFLPEAEAIVLGGEHDPAIVVSWDNSATASHDTLRADLLAASRVGIQRAVADPTTWFIDTPEMADWLRQPANTLATIRYRLATLARNAGQARDGRGRFASLGVAEALHPHLDGQPIGGAGFRAHREASRLKTGLATVKAASDALHAKGEHAAGDKVLRDLVWRGHQGYPAITAHYTALQRTADTEAKALGSDPRTRAALGALAHAYRIQLGRNPTGAHSGRLREELGLIHSYGRRGGWALDAPPTRGGFPPLGKADRQSIEQQAQDGVTPTRLTRAPIQRNTPLFDAKHHYAGSIGSGRAPQVVGIERAPRDPALAYQDHLSRAAPHIHWEIAQLAPAVQRQVGERLLELGRRYPGPFAWLRSVGAHDREGAFAAKKGGLAYTVEQQHADATWHPMIRLSPTLFGDYPALHEIVTDSIAKGWLTPDGHAAEHVVTHEFGHVVDQWLARQGGFLQRAAATWHTAHDQAHLSEYGATNPHEAFAEAFVAAHHPTPANLARPDVRAMQDLLTLAFPRRTP